SFFNIFLSSVFSVTKIISFSLLVCNLFSSSFSLLSSIFLFKSEENSLLLLLRSDNKLVICGKYSSLNGLLVVKSQSYKCRNTLPITKEHGSFIIIEIEDLFFLRSVTVFHINFIEGFFPF